MAVSDAVKSLTEDIEVSYETRMAAISDLVQETHQTLRNFKRERGEMAHDLKRSLASSEQERRQEFAIQIEEIKGLVAAIEKDTASVLADFRSDRQEMADALRSELASFQRNLSKEVDAMMAEFSADHQQARAEWGNITRVMAAKRAGTAGVPA